MKKQTIIFTISLFILTMAIGCHNNPDKKQDEAGSVITDTAPSLVPATDTQSAPDTNGMEPKVTADTTKPTAEKTVETRFELKSAGTDADKRTVVFVSFKGKKSKVAQIAGDGKLYSKKDYSTYQVPEKAIDACGAWWAGGGTYFYLIPSAKGVDVFEGFQD